jgi:DNA topoisomerase IA
MRIKERVRAEAIANAAAGHQGPLGVSIEEKRQAPPRLFDLPSLQKTCGQRWGWTADKTLSMAQELYDGDGKKLITYPRAEARYLSENQISDVGDCRRADPPAWLCSARNRAAGDTPRQVRPFLRQGSGGRFASCRRAQCQCSG